MVYFSLQNVLTQLEADADGEYKDWLLDVLSKYKIDVENSLRQMLEPAKYDSLAQLDLALSAALTVISEFQPDDNKTIKNTQSSSLNKLFYE